MVAYMLLCGHLPWKREQGQITTADLYVDMGEGKFFDRKVNTLCLCLCSCSMYSEEGRKKCMTKGELLVICRACLTLLLEGQVRSGLQGAALVDSNAAQPAQTEAATSAACAASVVH